MMSVHSLLFITYLFGTFMAIFKNFSCYSIKQGLMEALVNEQEKFVKSSIGHIIGTLVKHEFPNQTWPELMQWIQQMTTSQSEAEKEVNIYVYINY